MSSATTIMAMKLGGVRKSQEVADSNAIHKPLQVLNLVPMEMFAARVSNEKGREVKTVFYRIGNTWYVDPNGEIWAQKIRMVEGKMGDNLEKSYKELIEELAKDEPSPVEVTSAPKTSI